jgi:hypothetical protein
MAKSTLQTKCYLELPKAPVLVTWCNKDIRNYKGHSFRIGSVSHASSTGVSDEHIQLMGRWNSNAFKKYIRIEMFKLHKTKQCVHCRNLHACS